MYTFVPSVNTKFAVHCAPAVNVCTPGCTAAGDERPAPPSEISMVSALKTSKRRGLRCRAIKLPPGFMPRPQNFDAIVRTPAAYPRKRGSFVVRDVAPAGTHRAPQTTGLG